MITAVDTNVLLDVLNSDAQYGPGSERLLAEGLQAGALVISEPVYAELAAHFNTKADLDRFVAETGLKLELSDEEALFLAGKAWAEYSRRRPRSLTCSQCGAVQNIRCQRCEANIEARQHVVADFIIGAHALRRADKLVTRDPSYYATYFPDLILG